MKRVRKTVNQQVKKYSNCDRVVRKEKKKKMHLPFFGGQSVQFLKAGVIPSKFHQIRAVYKISQFPQFQGQVQTPKKKKKSYDLLMQLTGIS